MRPFEQNNQIARIQFMESLLDQIVEAVASKTVTAQTAQQMQTLQDYYTSPLWLADYEDDDAGRLPADLKRGVLSQDAVYDLMAEWEEIRPKDR